MNAIRPEPAARCMAWPTLASLASEPESRWSSKGFDDLVPPVTLAEARSHRDDLARLLRHEREAAADFLLALADFDRRRGWERLGHASLFAFLARELGLSNGAAHLRLSAARLLPRFPAVEVALRSGQLCISAAGELARVLTPENEAEVLPRFFRCSARDARVVAAALLPCPKPPRRDVVRVVQAPAHRASSVPGPQVASAAMGAAPFAALGLALPASGEAAAPQPVPPLRAHEVAAAPAGGARDEVEPLTADLRRLSVTVSGRFLEKLAAARTGLSHAMPRATTEQVLEAALDLLLERQARRQALVKRPRKAPGAPAAPPPASAANAAATATVATPGVPDPCAVPAAMEREVRLRDGNRCQFPLDAGGVCGSTWQVELDHVVPRALEGPTTVSNLRCACAFHNRYAAELALGPAAAGARRRRSLRPR